MSDVAYDPAHHYDRVTQAWTLLLGEELHYGVFETGDEPLDAATQNLTRLMAGAMTVPSGVTVLDVGCGTGAPACMLASQHGARVTGITTSEVGVEASLARAASQDLTNMTAFELRDGMDNGFPDASFDRVWVLESSHLMPARDRLLAECARVLKPGGRLALCDVMLRREMPFLEVRRLRKPLGILRDVFGDARMEQLETYRALADSSGLIVDRADDLTTATRPTFARWRANAENHRNRVVELFGADSLDRFVEASIVLEGFWDDGTLGYGLIAARKP